MENVEKIGDKHEQRMLINNLLLGIAYLLHTRDN